MTDERDPVPPPTADDAPDDAHLPRGRRAFSLLLIVAVGCWKVYEAIAAETVRATIAPSLYVLGVAGFAVSVIGPRQLAVVTFFTGAALCLAAMALDVH